MADIDIIFCDDALIAVNKPAGLLSVPGRGPHKQDCLALRVQREFADALIVHRLDEATSGLLVFGRGPGHARALSRQFVRREIDKRYVALVHGHPGAEGRIDLPLAADWPNRPMQKVDHETGKPSTTHWRRLAHDRHADVARLELHPITGRTHQLRVHLLAIGHPIVGDSLYNATTAARLMLHAERLRLRHPGHGQRLDLVSPAPF